MVGNTSPDLQLRPRTRVGLQLSDGAVAASAVEQEQALPKEESLCVVGLCDVRLCVLCVFYF